MLPSSSVAKNSFSSSYITKLTKRANWKWLSTTTSDKGNKPSEDEVRKHDNYYHKEIYDKHNLTPEQVINIDETGLNKAPRLLKMCVPKSVTRAANPTGDDKARITAMLGSNGDGEMLPLYLITKAKCRSEHDLSGSTMVKKILDGICEDGEWGNTSEWVLDVIIK